MNVAAIYSFGWCFSGVSLTMTNGFFFAGKKTFSFSKVNQKWKQILKFEPIFYGSEKMGGHKTLHFAILWLWISAYLQIKHEA